MGGKRDKAIERLKKLPKDYTFSEARSLLRSLGYIEDDKGSTSGSRVCFHSEKGRINLHKPHPADIMKGYMVKQLKEFLEEKGDI
ncbi:MAG: type II toxin-antitoxin system HicA family toxin [Lachnospiraceae bacterium]|nr:type II toxin-antitoxin system HicA family toxin [Lachnospiraceae bacterium]